MVRNIVGCLVKVGTGEWTVADFAAVMAAKDRKKAGVAAPACGLSLVHVPTRKRLQRDKNLSFAVFFAIS